MTPSPSSNLRVAGRLAVSVSVIPGPIGFDDVKSTNIGSGALADAPRLTASAVTHVARTTRMPMSHTLPGNRLHNNIEHLILSLTMNLECEVHWWRERRVIFVRISLGVGIRTHDSPPA